MKDDTPVRTRVLVKRKVNENNLTVKPIWMKFVFEHIGLF